MSDPDIPPLEDARVAVIGAGMAGLTAARRLAKAGAIVTVFEKSRGLGGRLATRRLEIGAVDHGAQYVTAREPAFKAWIARAKAEGAVSAWAPRGKDSEEDWLVGMPGMSGLVASLVDGFDLRTETEVAAIRALTEGFDLVLKDGTEVTGFDRIIVAVPGPQAAALLDGFPPPFDRVATASFGPCWTLLAAFEDTVDPGFDVVRDVGPLAWTARSLSKPGRTGEIWVAQANPEWSRANLEDQAEIIAPRLLEALTAAVGPLPEPVHLAAHRWRYALVERAVGETFLLSPDGRIGACGDWLIAPRVEAAWASGDGLAEAMIAHARAEP